MIPSSGTTPLECILVNSWRTRKLLLTSGWIRSISMYCDLVSGLLSNVSLMSSPYMLLPAVKCEEKCALLSTEKEWSRTSVQEWEFLGLFHRVLSNSFKTQKNISHQWLKKKRKTLSWRKYLLTSTFSLRFEDTVFNRFEAALHVEVSFWSLFLEKKLNPINVSIVVHARVSVCVL